MTPEPIPNALHIVAPSRLQIGESFDLKIRVLGEPWPVPAHAGFMTLKPGLHTPYNLNTERQIQYYDNTVAGWRGTLRLDGQNFEGPEFITFDGCGQGSYGENDDRPIKIIAGCKFTRPGFHFIRVIDEATGLEGWSNPVKVTTAAPGWQIAWGDPHTHTFFTDAIRSPEDIYHFARYEGFLDFCALTDHSEGLTDLQWDYFQAVTNAANDPGRFVTLVGQEWTNHLEEYGAPGHRNIYVPGDKMPILRCTDPGTQTLEQLWATLDKWRSSVRAFPHHSANTVMGTDWNLPWNPAYETAVEIYSVWGNSERSAAAGNTRPIWGGKGELPGRHVQDALRQGRRMSFLGGGDTHDGRPGNALHRYAYPRLAHVPREQGFTAALVPSLTRENVFDAMAGGQTYATTASRIYLESKHDRAKSLLTVDAASEEGIERVDLVYNGEDIADLSEHQRVCEREHPVPPIGPTDYLYVRVTTKRGNMAWSTPFYGTT